MQTLTAEPMEPSEQFCPNLTCCARGQKGLGNIVIHDRKRQRYRCKRCKHTFSARRGTMFEGLRTSMDVVTIVITLLAFGCPVQAIVQAYGLDERTVASWRDRAGKQCQRVHTEVVRQMSHGSFEQAMLLLQRSGGGQVLNTSYIERFNGTVRERLASLTRKCRHAAQRLEALETEMYLIGSTYNFCCFHHQLSTRATEEAQWFLRQTKALASGLTDHLWSLSELLQYKVAPAPWVEPKRRGRSRKQPLAEATLPKRPRGRPRIWPLPDPSVPKRPQGRPRKIPLSAFTV